MKVPRNMNGNIQIWTIESHLQFQRGVPHSALFFELYISGIILKRRDFRSEAGDGGHTFLPSCKVFSKEIIDDFEGFFLTSKVGSNCLSFRVTLTVRRAFQYRPAEGNPDIADRAVVINLDILVVLSINLELRRDGKSS